MRKYIFILSILLVTFACSKPLEKIYTSQNIALDSIYNSNELEELIAPYRKIVDSQMNEVISFSDSTLIKYGPESPLGNFTADIIFEKGITLRAKGFEDLNIKNTFVLLNFGGLRAPINAGEITIGNVFELMPFDNTISFVKLNQNAIKEVCAYLIKMNGQPVSNAIFDLRDEESKIYIKDNLVDVTDDFYVITSNYLASGGDRMTFLSEANLKWDSGILMRDVFIEYIRGQNKIECPIIEGRIRMTK